MPTQTESGKAFEYALANSLFIKLEKDQNIILLDNNVLKNTKRCYDLFNKSEKDAYNKAAHVAVEHIMTIEPRLQNKLSQNDTLEIQIQPDKQGVNGDIRDVVMLRSDHEWEIGFSAKNNHTAVKHSRLSHKIDFGKCWVGFACSAKYMNKVSEIFGELQILIKQNPKLKWNDLKNKKSRFYIPILCAFKQEIYELANEHEEVPTRLLEYLLGQNDFYKIMKLNQFVKIQGYNLHGTLNKAANKETPIRQIGQLGLPTRIIEIKIEGDNKIIMTFDKGWALSFRIHNASTLVEPSLKFDIRLVGNPSDLYTHEKSW